jgi:aspartate-semialdehyde dehydrogenase
VTRLAILHPTTLVGRDLRDSLNRRPALWDDLRLLSTDEEEIGTVVDVRDSVAMVERPEPGDLEGTDLVFLCGDMAATAPLLEEIPAETTAVVLSMDADLGVGEPLVAGVNAHRAEPGRVLLSPHPAAVMLVHLLHPLREFEPQGATATLIQPASMFGDPGVDELFEQARHILAMVGQRPPEIFGRQLAFNIFPALTPGERLAALIRSVLEMDLPVTLQILQGGVFHCFSASLFVRLARPPGAEEIHRCFQADPWIDLVDEEELPGPIDAAARDQVLVRTVLADPQQPGGYWIWGVMDNLTCGGAANAMEIAETVLGAG